jgi:hypothetical protein
MHLPNSSILTTFIPVIFYLINILKLSIGSYSQHTVNGKTVSSLNKPLLNNYISCLINNKTNPSLKSLFLISNLLDIHLKLFGLDNYTHNRSNFLLI